MNHKEAFERIHKLMDEWRDCACMGGCSDCIERIAEADDIAAKAIRTFGKKTTC